MRRRPADDEVVIQFNRFLRAQNELCLRTKLGVLDRVQNLLAVHRPDPGKACASVLARPTPRPRRLSRRDEAAGHREPDAAGEQDPARRRQRLEVDGRRRVNPGDHHEDAGQGVARSCQHDSTTKHNRHKIARRTMNYKKKSKNMIQLLR